MKREIWLLAALMAVLLAAVILSLAGCGTMPASPSSAIKKEVFYKRDMQICLDDTCSDGVMVLPRKSSYKFKIKAYGVLDLFSFSTCHRDETTQEHSKRRWFGSGNKKVEGKFSPAPGIEDQYCPAYFAGYDLKGLHSWGFVDFETPEANVPATLFCNGDVIKSQGVSICQSKAGLITAIEFDRPMDLMLNQGACALPVPIDKKRWQFQMPLGECVHAFYDKDDNIHRMTTLGYQSIIVREP